MNGDEARIIMYAGSVVVAFVVVAASGDGILRVFLAMIPSVLIMGMAGLRRLERRVRHNLGKIHIDEWAVVWRFSDLVISAVPRCFKEGCQRCHLPLLSLDRK